MDGFIREQENNGWREAQRSVAINGIEQTVQRYSRVVGTYQTTIEKAFWGGYAAYLATLDKPEPPSPISGVPLLTYASLALAQSGIYVTQSNTTHGAAAVYVTYYPYDFHLGHLFGYSVVRLSETEIDIMRRYGAVTRKV